MNQPCSPVSKPIAQHRRLFEIVSIIIISAGVISLLLVLPSIAVRADIGPAPINPAGAGIDPGNQFRTRVRMESEKVTIQVESFERPKPKLETASPAYHMRGKVTAEFWLKNLGSKGEAYEVWFPLAASASNPQWLAMEPEKQIQDFKVWIDNKPVKNLTEVQAPALGFPDEQSAWAKWPMDFKPGKQVYVKLAYTLYPGGRMPFADIEYILQTGAGWSGTIGKAVVKIVMPYKINSQNVVHSTTSYAMGDTYNMVQPAGYKIVENTIEWRFSELEPTAKHNISVDAMVPYQWQALEKARMNATRTPKNVQAWLKLAQEASKSLLILKIGLVSKYSGAQEIANEATQAFRKALALAPGDVRMYRDYAWWLIRLKGYCPPEMVELVRVGLERFPNHKDLLQVIKGVNDYAEVYGGEANCFIGLTTTPTATATKTLTPTRLTPTAKKVTLTPTPKP